MMRRRSLTLWYCAFALFLLVALSAKPSGGSISSDEQSNDSSMQYVVYANFMGNSSDQVEPTRYNSTGDEVYELQTNSRKSEGADDSMRYESRDHEESNELPMEPRTDADGRGNSTAQQLGRNIPGIGNEVNSMSYEQRAVNHSRDGNKSTVAVALSHGQCNNDTCIQLCCPLGERLFKEKCIAGKGEDYAFPDLYEYTTDNLLQSEDVRLDQLFQLVIYDPCKGNQRYLLNPDDYPDDGYVFFINGSLYQPHYNEFIESTSYCLAIVHRDKYEVAVCFGNMTEIAEAEEPDGVPMPFGLIVSLPFLLATFVVYSILPELRNMHGYTLRGYVGSLFVAYTNLAVLQLTPSDNVSNPVCIALGTAQIV